MDHQLYIQLHSLPLCHARVGVPHSFCISPAYPSQLLRVHIPPVQHTCQLIFRRLHGFLVSNSRFLKWLKSLPPMHRHLPSDSFLVNFSWISRLVPPPLSAPPCSEPLFLTGMTIMGNHHHHHREGAWKQTGGEFISQISLLNQTC